MSDNNSVILKGNKDGIVVMLDKDLEFEAIKSALYKKVTDAKKFFGNSKTSILFKGRSLTDIEENELLEIISHGSDLNIAFVSVPDTGSSINKKEEPVIQVNPQTIDDALNRVSSIQNNTIFHKGSLRSGQALRHIGSIVIIGDVNPGGEIIAEGNVIILGSLKGVVHAGCSGNYDCFVAALNLSPTQLRISDIITYIPKHMNKTYTVAPSLAYIQEKQIYIAPLV